MTYTVHVYTWWNDITSKYPWSQTKRKKEIKLTEQIESEKRKRMANPTCHEKQKGIIVSKKLTCKGSKGLAFKQTGNVQNEKLKCVLGLTISSSFYHSSQGFKLCGVLVNGQRSRSEQILQRWWCVVRRRNRGRAGSADEPHEGIFLLWPQASVWSESVPFCFVKKGFLSLLA